MSKHLEATLLFIVLLMTIAPASALAVSSTNFYKQGGDVFDDWDVCRTNAAGDNGFFQVFSQAKFCPVIVGESLGENADSAYQIGQQFALDYPDVHQRADKIFIFVRDKVKYIPDEDQFGFPEFAQNADELATAIEDEDVAYADCEDYAVLLAVMYKGAGFRSAIVLAPNHAAALVYLPEYNKVNQTLSVDGESGWVWAEATGGNNPLGWIPERFIGKKLGVCEVEDKAITALETPDKSSTTVTREDSSTGIHISPFFGVIAFMWLISLFRRRRR
jgi:hypothetical protein